MYSTTVVVCVCVTERESFRTIELTQGETRRGVLDDHLSVTVVGLGDT